MANKFKKALALVLAAAMVVTVAPAPAASTAEAASKYSITKKTSISPAKTYTYKVKGVSKKQYIKVNAAKGVTVKVGSKTVKKATKTAGTVKVKGTGKAISLKLIAKDSVANYKTKLKVNIFNKNNNKKVKTLSSTSTVKVEDLKITSVVPAAQGGDYKYVTATFNKSVSGLSAADVKITNKGTGKVHSIETVSVSSNGKTVNMTLLGDKAAAGSTFLEANTDYILEVTQNSATASMEFTIDAVVEGVVVTDVDATKRTLTTSLPNKDTVTYADAVNLNVPSSLSVDFEDLLGRTVTVWYDKNNAITKITPNDETVIYGGFLVTKDAKTNEAYLTDAITQTKYYTADANYIAGSSIYPTVMVDKETKAGNTRSAFTYAQIPDGNSAISYGKVILNSTGTVRTIVGVTKWSDYLQVDTVSGNTIVNGDKSKTLKDYTIVKDGKTIAISDLQKNDVVFWNNTGKFADVYTTSFTGALSAVYSDKFTFMGRTMKYTNTLVNAQLNDYAPATQTAMYKDTTSGKLTEVDPDYMETLKASGKDITVYIDRAASPIYISGTEGTAAYTNVTLALVKDAVGYLQSAEGYVKLTGFNAATSKVETYDIRLSDLTTITNGSNTSTVGKNKVTKIISDAAAPSTTPTKVEDDLTAAATTITFGSDLKALQIVTLSLDSSNVVRGISRKASETLTSMDGNSTDANFKAGYKTLNTYAVASSTPVYTVDTTTNKETASAASYGTFGSTVLFAGISNVQLYTDADKKNVTSIVIDKVSAGANYVSTGETGDPIKAVVSVYLAAADGKPSSLTVISGKDETTYTAFNSSLSGLDVETGDIVTLTPSKDGKTVEKCEKLDDYNGTTGEVITAGYKQDSAAKTTFTLYGIKEISGTLASNVTPTIVKYDTTDPSNIKLTSIELDELYETENLVKASWLAGTLSPVVDESATATIDTIVLTPVSAISAAKSAIAATNTAYTALNASATATTWATYGQAYATAIAMINAYEGSGGTANATNLGSAYTTFETNETAANTKLDADETEVTSADVSNVTNVQDKTAAADIKAGVKAHATTTATNGSVTGIIVKTTEAVGETTLTVTVVFAGGLETVEKAYKTGTLADGPITAGTDLMK